MNYSNRHPKRISSCKVCGTPISWRFLELFEKQNPHSMFEWNRVLIEELGWTAFDAENPALVHEHRRESRSRPISKSEVLAA